MSGGKGGGNGGGGGLPNPPNDCSRFTKEVILSSPDPAVLTTLTSDQILDLTFESDSGQRVILAVTNDGEVAGSVTGETGLRNCMIEGFSYVAEVLSIHGGSCRVKIRIS